MEIVFQSWKVGIPEKKIKEQTLVASLVCMQSSVPPKSGKDISLFERSIVINNCVIQANGQAMCVRSSNWSNHPSGYFGYWK